MHKSISFFLVILLPLFSAAQHHTATEKQVLKSVKQGTTEVLADYLTHGGDADATLDGQKKTLLSYAVKYQNLKAVKLLLDNGADVNLVSDGKTPLMFAIQNKNYRIMNLLLHADADIETEINNKNTALIYAVKQRCLLCAQMLVGNGATVQYRNGKGMSALDYANLTNNVPMAEYLVRVIEMQNYYKNLSAYFDGPHMQWLSDNLLRVFYMEYDTTLHNFLIDERFVDVNSDTTIVHGFAGDTTNYTITRHIATEPTHFDNVDKIMAFGDLHGHYSALIKFMQHHSVIDDKLQWSWESGHVVILGDVFDRGNEVTETLWFIYQLDQQARRKGGRVHLLLGNHEVMVMHNDTRYLNRKYELFSNYFMRDYSGLYDSTSVLGRWLLSRNTVITINDLLFSHAGISPAVLRMGIPLEKINSLVLEYLNTDPNQPSKEAALMNLLLNENGPLWYRGYMLDGVIGELIGQKEVDKILAFYNVDKIIIAHTEVQQLTSMYDGKVIAIDVPIRTSGIIPEALLIEDRGFYRLSIEGKTLCGKEYGKKQEN